MDQLWLTIVQWLHTLGLHVDAGTARDVAAGAARATAQLDMLFSPVKLAVIGCHGAEIRGNPTAPVQSRAPLDEKIRRELYALAAKFPGTKNGPVERPNAPVRNPRRTSSAILPSSASVGARFASPSTASRTEL